MKSKTILFGAIMSVLATPAAFAAGETNLTTRGYVDGGLSFVYQKAADAQDDVDSLKSVVGAAANGQNEATGLVGKVADLENVVGANPSDGLRGTVGTLQTNVGTLQGDVTNLKTQVENLPAAKTYTSGTGITVTAGQGDNPSTINLNLNNPTNGTNYVFQSDGAGGGTWTALSVENNWDASAEARITGTQNGQTE